MKLVCYRFELISNQHLYIKSPNRQIGLNLIVEIIQAACSVEHQGMDTRLTSELGNMKAERKQNGTPPLLHCCWLPTSCFTARLIGKWTTFTVHALRHTSNWIKKLCKGFKWGFSGTNTSIKPTLSRRDNLLAPGLMSQTWHDGLMLPPA